MNSQFPQSPPNEPAAGKPCYLPEPEALQEAFWRA